MYTTQDDVYLITTKVPAKTKENLSTKLQMNNVTKPVEEPSYTMGYWNK